MKGTIRLAAWCLAIALVALPVVGLLRGWFAADRWPVTQLTVQAEFKHVTAAEIRTAVLPRLGKGFFALDLDAVQKAVAALPWVESVEARKRWPDTLQLRIYERQPFARWNDKQLISRQGRVFDAPGVEQLTALPGLSGPDARLAEVVSFYADVSKAFDATFARLFPGGEGRLVLTAPDDMLTTGVEVEARPPGKKVKRLSLLSGGERSLVAVAFLVALFKARPSPFYILDEVEAALDDTNLGRLLEIYEELRENSQLLVITHQKRTMEVGDALYGVTMRGDGVSAVISQRLREQESA